MNEYGFGQWLPDGQDFKNPGLERCENVIPSPTGYQPAPGLVATGASVTGDVIGAASFERKDGTTVIVAATTTDLFIIVGSTVTASGLSLSLSRSDIVVFSQFNTKIYASTKAGDTWVLDDIETDTTFGASPGSPPNANALGRVGEFLVTGDLLDIDSADAPYRLRWSRFNDPGGTWGTDISFQSGATELDAEHGPITAISGGSFGFIFQKSGISRMTYSGGSSVFRLELYEKNRGCIAPRSVARVGDVCYYLSVDSFARTDGSSVVPISRGKVWKWFLANVNENWIRFVTASVNYRERCVIWSFPGGSTQAGTGQLWYNWEIDEWSYVKLASDAVVPGTQAGVTLETLAATNPDLDAMTTSLDSPEFQARGREIYMFTDGALQTMSGESLEAYLESGDVQPATGRRSFVRSVTPLIANEDENTSVKLGCRDRMTETVAFSNEAQMGPVGFAPFNHDARYFRTAVTIPAGARWSDATGYQIDADISGLT